MAASIVDAAMIDNPELCPEPQDTESTILFKKALQAVIDDEGFGLSDKGARAVLCAQRLLEYSRNSTDPAVFVDFCDELVRGIQNCIEHRRKLKCHYHREKMWEKYYKYRSSNDYSSMWHRFLTTSIGFQASPIFYQYVTDSVMQTLLKSHFEVPDSIDDEMVESTLDFEEANALRYTAGYVIRSVGKKISRSRHELKDNITLCLQELATGTTESELETDQWTSMLSRGGLIHVSDTTYMVFYTMETTFRQNFSLTRSEDLKVIREKIVANEELQFYWSLVSVNWSKSESTELLQMIVEHWITIRGFSSASAFNELYKRESKKSLEKTKGLRKGLQPILDSIIRTTSPSGSSSASILLMKQ